MWSGITILINTPTDSFIQVPNLFRRFVMVLDGHFPKSLCGVLVFDSVSRSSASASASSASSTQHCHTPSFNPNFVTHHLLTHNFVTHSLSLTTLLHTHTHHLCHTTLSHTIFHTQLCYTQLCHTPSFTHTTLLHTIFHTHTHTTLSHTIFHTHVATQLCHTLALGVVLHDIDLRFAWQGGTYGTGLALVARLVPVGRPGRRGTLRGRHGTRRHRQSICVASVAGVALGDMDVVFSWQAWHLASPTLSLAWPAWHLLTSTLVLRGRRGTYRTGLALVARSVPVGHPERRGTLRGRRGGTWRRGRSICLAGVALGDMDVAFVWQRGTWRHPPSLWHGRRGACSHQLSRFAWQAWRLSHWAGSGGACACCVNSGPYHVFLCAPVPSGPTCCRLSPRWPGVRDDVCLGPTLCSQPSMTARAMG